MEYYFSKKDSSGYVHSIDNLIMTYYVENLGVKCIKSLISDLQEIHGKHTGLDYWEKFDINPCRKYSFYQHAIHMDEGIYILLGHYVDYDRETKKADVFPMLRMELNPNKHATKSVLKDVMELVNKNCYDGVLTKYDYAVDIPLTPDYVAVFGSNKEKGLFKGTRYFGQRNKNGYCRIYDKQEEQKLDYPLTRIEHVVSTTKTTKKLSFEKVYIKSDNKTEEKLSKTDAVIVELCNMLKANNLDFEDTLNKLDRRKKKTIMEHLSGNGYKLLEYDKAIHDELLQLVYKEFGVKEIIEEKKELKTDEDGFIDMENNDFDVPFD